MINDNAKKAYEAFTGANKADGGKTYVSFDQLSPSAQGAWSAAVDAARDHATEEQQAQPAKVGGTAVTESKDPAVRNQDPTGTRR